MKIRTLITIAALTMVAAMAVALACAPVASINAVTPTSTYTLRQGVAYGPLVRQRLDVYSPRSAAPVGGWPVVVFFYGGSWVRGERSDYKFVGEAFAARGILTLVADYRLYPEVLYPDFLFDGAQALAYGLTEAAHLGGNPKRVFVMGHSAGAYNAAMLALDPRWLGHTDHAPMELAGWIGLAGPYDFLPINNLEARPVFHHPNYPPDSQPITHAAESHLPVFLGAALNDDLVNPTRNTLGLAQILRNAHVPVSLHTYGGVNHVTLIGAMSRPLRWLAPVLDDVAAFVENTPVDSERQVVKS